MAVPEPSLVRPRCLRVAALACLAAIVALAGANPTSQEPPARTLLVPETSGAADALMPSVGPASATLRRSAVRVDFGALDATRLTMALAPGLNVEAIRDGEAGLVNGRRVWMGRVTDDPMGRVVLVASGALLQGSVRTRDGAFSIEPVGDGRLHAVRQVNLEALPPELPPLTADVAPGQALDGQPHAEPQEGEAATIDLLVAFTPTARDAAGSDAAMEARIALAVAETNLAFADSGVTQRLRLVGTELVGYAETADLAWDLERLTDPRDGFMDIVHARRQATGADLVQLIVGSPYANACGVAWMMRSVSTAFAPLAFSVTAYRCISPNYTFGHELAHNMGSAHAPEDFNVTPPLPYGYGYKDPGGDFRTIMSYDCPSGCPRVLLFSNPTVAREGKPTGSATRHDNARSLNETSATVAAFRPARDPATRLGAPVGITARFAGTTAALAWSPPASGSPQGYLVEVGSSEGRADIATYRVGAMTSFVVPDVPPRTYYVRVRALDGLGPGPPSASARVVVTSGGPCEPPAGAPVLLVPRVDGSAVTLTWTPPTAGGAVERYLIGVGTAPYSTDVAVIDTGSTALSYQTMAANGTYYVRVAAQNRCGVGEASNSEPLAVDATVPGAPSGLAATVGPFGRVALTWRVPPTGAPPTSYLVEAGSAPGASDVAVLPTANATPSLAVSAAPATYYVRVRGVAAGVTGSPSAEIVVRVR